MPPEPSKTAAAPGAPIAEIRQALQDRHRVEARDGLPKDGKGPPVSLLRPSLLVAEHFETACDLLVHVPRTGTLGLVHWLDDSQSDAIEVTARTHLEHAAHIRHLAANHFPVDDGYGSDGKAQPLPLSVEVVLAFRQGESDLAPRLGALLRRIVAEQEYLHGIGVNLLPWPEDADTDADERKRALDKAFCWLLTATRHWFGFLRDKQPTIAAPIQELTVRNWRLPGTRVLKFGADATIHLVHGRNGSGKSSLAEAIEFALTGNVERLAAAGVTDILALVSHRSGTGDGHRHKADVAPMLTGDKSAIPPVGAFLLDQRRMDRLVCDRDEDRADYFLRSFFPTQRAVQEEFVERRADLADASRLLDLLIVRRSRNDDEALVQWDALTKKLQWACDERVEVGRVLSDWWALSMGRDGEGDRGTLLADLRPFLPNLESRLAELPSDPIAIDAAAGWLDRLSGLGTEITDALRNAETALQKGLRVLEAPGLADWLPRPETDAATIQTLKEWLDAMAMADLIQRQGSVVATLQRASDAGWSVPSDLPGGLHRARELPRSARDELGKATEQWQGRLDRLRRQVAGFGRDPVTEGRPTTRPVLSPAMIADLDAAGFVLRGKEEGTAPLGRTLSQAVQEGRAIAYGDGLLIGDSGWHGLLTARLRDLASRASALNTMDGRRGLSNPADFLRATQAAHQAAAAFKAAADRLKQSLLEQILPTEQGGSPESDLPAALQEMIAVLTPARWAYGPVTLLRRGTEGRDLAIGYQGEVQGEVQGGQLRLNTAELNVLTVALFLLCAPAAPNPSRLLVFDDPLQNMDEMTVTAFARGVSRLEPLLQSAGWRLLFLFHGEDDVARFESECGCAVVRLPWLPPLGAGQVEEATCLEPSRRFGTSRQRVGSVLEVSQLHRALLPG